ncbi:MAG: tRNA epoxyqueuosine(34) reductase QueG [Actinomycetia bacterium]|nr:tRNA epoxyqueuosine(34) reductase QueG [Actinomycetes bacterium]
MRPANPPSPSADAAYLADLARLTEPFGVTHTGVAPAAVLSRARVAIDDRVRRGLTDGMQFTFRNPSRSTDPQRAVPGAQSVFVAASPYLLADVPRPQGPQARVARYAWVDHYAPLRRALRTVARRLRADGYRAVAFVDDNSLVDREVAHLAGIGWFGKNANLLLPGAGSWFVLGSVVTTAALPLQPEPVADGCGACRRCLDVCPTAAIIEPGVVDAARCLAWVLQKPGVIAPELRELVGDRIYGCDDCQEVCPPTIRFGPTNRAPAAAAGKAWIAVLDLLRSSDAELLAQWSPWYLADRDPRWIRRNALVVLGNIGDAADSEVQDVVAQYVVHDDPLLREHAEWAAHRLGLHAMPERSGG